MLRKVSQFWQKFVLAAAVSVIFFAFQNCSFGGYKSASTKLSGNGSGYDGKLFVHLDPIRVCADGKPYDSAIDLRDGHTYIVRRDCTDLPPALQVEVSAVENPLNASVLTFEGRIYLEYLTVAVVQSNAALETVMAGGKFDEAESNLAFLGHFVSKFAPTGSKIWSLGHTWFDALPKALLLKNGDVLVSSQHTPKVSDNAGTTVFTWITRLDASGQVLWTKQIPDARFNLSAISEDNSGVIFLGGAVFDSTAVTAQPFLIRLSAMGNLLSRRTFAAGQGAISSFKLDGADLFVTGSSGATFTTMTPFLAKLDSAGEPVWSRSFTGLNKIALSFSPSGEPVLRALYLTPAALNGFFDTRSAFLKLNRADGLISLSKKFSTESADKVEYSELYPATGGGYYLTTSNGALMTVIKLDAAFDVQWSENFALNSDATFVALNPRADGTFWIDVNLPSKLAPYSGTLFSAVDFSGWPSSCATCQPANLPGLVTLTTPTSTAGPALAPLTAVDVFDFNILPPFTNFRVNLPFF